jgi:hypothetical protein
MTRDDVLDLCAHMPGVVEDYPFGEGVAVFKVALRAGLGCCRLLAWARVLVL